MYFWRTELLARDLKAGVLSSREKMKYFLAWVILIGLSFSSIEAAPLSHPHWGEDIVGVFCLVGFVVHCHRLNQKGDGSEFIERLLCVSWPEAMKLAICSVVVCFTFSLADRFTPWLVWKIISDALEWLLLLFFLRRISLRIKWIAGAP